VKLLDWATSLGRGLLETAADGSALQLLAEAPVAIAVFRAGDYQRVTSSAPWNALFDPGAPTPPPIVEALDRALRSGTTVSIPELTFQSEQSAAFVRACRIVIAPVANGTRSVLASASEVTDDVVARRLEVGRTVSIWSGTERDPDYCNAAWRTYSTGEVEGPPHDWRRYVFADDLVRCEETFTEARKARKTLESEARLRRTDGTFRWHQVRFRGDLDTARWYATALDIEDTHYAQKQRIALLDRLLLALSEAEDANRAKDNFLATVSHELRAPVTTIMLWEKVLRDHIDDVKLRNRALDAIRESASAQSRLVGDLLDISRAISGKLRLERRRILVESVLAAAVEAAVPAANAKQIEITTHYRPRLGRVMADPARLRQVFDNLLSNAVKFTPQGGRIRVTTNRDRSSAVIAISDNGRGIEEPFLRRLFTPFVQDEEVLTRSEGGLGLGLAIASQLVALHDGTLSAASPGLNQGSTFTVTLPFANRRTSTPVPSTPPPNAQRLDGVRVLLVDDEPRVREALKLLLGRVGAEVQAAGSAAEAREMLENMQPDVMVCDISMPGEDGYTFIRTLRSTKGRSQNVPAIALTAYASDRDRERAAAAGFDAHLAKPIQLLGLAAAIDHLLAARRPQIA
jgi:signal transduction histidine kinase/CheY-like chemotaxis protein